MQRTKLREVTLGAPCQRALESSMPPPPARTAPPAATEASLPQLGWGGAAGRAFADRLRERWTLEYLRAVHSDTVLDVSVSMDGTVRGTVEEHETLRLAFGREFLAQIITGPESASALDWRRRPSQLRYHLAQCPLQSLPLLDDDVRSFRDDVEKWAGRSVAASNLWFAVGAGQSSLHYDSFDNLIVVLRGRKHFLLLPPAATRALAPRAAHGTSANHTTLDAEGVAAAVGCLEGGEAAARRVEVCAGDSLFIPEGWWHQVDSAEESSRDHDLHSISATFTYDGGHFSQVDSPDEVTLAVNLWWNGPSHDTLRRPRTGVKATAEEEYAHRTANGPSRPPSPPERPLAGERAYVLRRAFEASVEAERTRLLVAAIAPPGPNGTAAAAAAEAEVEAAMAAMAAAADPLRACSCADEADGASPSAPARARLVAACAAADERGMLREVARLSGADVLAALARAAAESPLQLASWLDPARLAPVAAHTLGQRVADATSSPCEACATRARARLGAVLALFADEAAARQGLLRLEAEFGEQAARNVLHAELGLGAGGGGGGGGSVAGGGGGGTPPGQKRTRDEP